MTLSSHSFHARKFWPKGRPQVPLKQRPTSAFKLQLHCTHFYFGRNGEKKKAQRPSIFSMPIRILQISIIAHLQSLPIRLKSPCLLRQPYLLLKVTFFGLPVCAFTSNLPRLQILWTHSHGHSFRCLNNAFSSSHQLPSTLFQGLLKDSKHGSVLLAQSPSHHLYNSFSCAF